MQSLPDTPNISTFTTLYQTQNRSAMSHQRDLVAMVEDGIRLRIYSIWAPVLATGIPDSPAAIHHLEELAWREVIMPLLAKRSLAHISMQAVNQGRGIEAVVQVVLQGVYWP